MNSPNVLMTSNKLVSLLCCRTGSGCRIPIPSIGESIQ